MYSTVKHEKETRHNDERCDESAGFYSTCLSSRTIGTKLPRY